LKISAKTLTEATFTGERMYASERQHGLSIALSHQIEIRCWGYGAEARETQAPPENKLPFPQSLSTAARHSLGASPAGSR